MPSKVTFNIKFYNSNLNVHKLAVFWWIEAIIVTMLYNCVEMQSWRSCKETWKRSCMNRRTLFVFFFSLPQSFLYNQSSWHTVDSQQVFAELIKKIIKLYIDSVYLLLSGPSCIHYPLNTQWMPCVNDTSWCPKRSVHFLTLETFACDLIWKMAFAGVIKDQDKIIWIVQRGPKSHDKCPYQKHTEEPHKERTECGHVKTEAELRVIWP